MRIERDLSGFVDQLYMLNFDQSNTYTFRYIFFSMSDRLMYII